MMTYQRILLSLLSIVLASGSARATGKSYVAVCDQPNEALAGNAVYQQAFWQPSGQQTSLYVLNTLPEEKACQIQRLPFAATAVQWASLLPPAVASQLDGGVVLEGNIDRNKKFRPDNVSALQEPPEEPEPTFKAAAQTREAEEHAVENKTAGDHSQQKAGHPLLVVDSSESIAQQPAAEKTVPKKMKGRQPDISQAGFPKSPFVHSGWIWQPQAWQKNPEVTLHILKRWQMRQVYITIPVNEPANASEASQPRWVTSPDLLKQFLVRAHQQGVRVWAVDGDRFALLPEARKDFLARAKAYAAFNAQTAPDAKIDGLQFDIEPYLVPGYNLDSPTWNESYLTLLKGVKTETDLAVEVVLPFWFQQQKAGQQLFLDQLAEWVDGLAIMDYRTDTEQIHHFAKPFLDWGVAYNKPVQIALESGFLPDTPTQVYRPAFSGDLYLLRKNNFNLLILLNEPIKAPLQGKSFAFSHASSSASRQVTFYRQSDQLTRTLTELQPLLTPWKSFAGMAIHGID